MASFIHDDHGTMEIPMRLVVYVILTAAIVAVAAIGLQYLKSPMTTNIMEKQIGEIKVSLNTMQYGATRNLIDPASPNGNMRTFKIKIPDDVEYLALGVDPDPDNDDDLTNTKEGLLTERGNVIFYKSRTGGKVRVPLDDSIEIREGLLENGRWVVNKNANGMQYGVVVRGSGDYEITFELVYDPISKQKYTLSHFTDDLNAYINPYDTAALPNKVQVSVNPGYIPADGKKTAEVIVQLKDKKGRDAAKNDVKITLETTLGDLTYTELTTLNGRATTTITSKFKGTAMITAKSTGLNKGLTHLTITQAPIALDFNEWIKNGEELISNQFTINQELTYSVYFWGNGTACLEWPIKQWPIARIEINDGIKKEQIGERTIDIADVDKKTFPQKTLKPGNYELSIKMTNDLNLGFCDRNIYVERVELTE